MEDIWKAVTKKKKGSDSFLTFKPFKWRLTAADSSEQPFEALVYFKALLTHFRHLRHRSYKGPIWKFRRIVIDVLHFDDEFWLWFQGLLCVAVQRLCVQDIMCFLFPIQAFSGVNISCHFIDDKYSPSSFPVQDVPDRSIAFIWIWVKLQGKADSVWMHRKDWCFPFIRPYMSHGCTFYNDYSKLCWTAGTLTDVLVH